MSTTDLVREKLAAAYPAVAPTRTDLWLAFRNEFFVGGRPGPDLLSNFYGGSELAFADRERRFWSEFQVVPSVSESFTAADGPGLRGDLAWIRRNAALANANFSHEIVSNQSFYQVTGPGTFEDLWSPAPILSSSNMTMSVDVVAANRPVQNDYWLSIGIGGRYVFGDFGNGLSYRSIAVETGRNDQLGGGTDRWHIILWDISDGRVAESGVGATVLAAATAPVGDVTLPGTLTLTLDGSAASATFEHNGSAETLSASATDPREDDSGILGFGGGHILPGPESGSMTCDNYAAAVLP